MSKFRPSEYQDPMNVTGFNTSKDIAHGFRPEPTNYQHPPRTCVYDTKPIELVMKTPGPIHDQFVTTNSVYHGPKRVEEIYLQPYHPQAPGANLTHIKPNFSLRIARGDFNLNPNYYISENHDAFQARRPLMNMYGGPAVYTPPRDVFVPQYQDDIYPFDKDIRHSVLRHAHPYLSVTQFDYRNFQPEELAYQEMLKQMELGEKKSDVAIKLRVRPMLNSFEQKVHKLGQQSSMDRFNEAPAPRDYRNKKFHFKCPPYSGCPPRAFQPVEHIGQTTTFSDSYSWPYSGKSKDNFTHPLKVCYVQPTISDAGAHEIPHMYHSESEIYGGGRGVCAFLDIGKQDHSAFTKL